MLAAWFELPRNCTQWFRIGLRVVRVCWAFALCRFIVAPGLKWLRGSTGKFPAGGTAGLRLYFPAGGTAGLRLYVPAGGTAGPQVQWLSDSVRCLSILHSKSGSYAGTRESQISKLKFTAG